MNPEQAAIAARINLAVEMIEQTEYQKATGILRNLARLLPPPTPKNMEAARNGMAKPLITSGSVGHG